MQTRAKKMPDSIWYRLGVFDWLDWVPRLLHIKDSMSKTMLACRAYRKGWQAGFAAGQRNAIKNSN